VLALEMIEARVMSPGLVRRDRPRQAYRPDQCDRWDICQRVPPRLSLGIWFAGLPTRLAPKFVFNAATTEAGRQALGFYHEKRDELRNIGLGPEHDWSSHSADAFGLMAIDYQEPAQSANFNRNINYGDRGWR
jgi:hypothetical protein